MKKKIHKRRPKRTSSSSGRGRQPQKNLVRELDDPSAEDGEALAGELARRASPPRGVSGSSAPGDGRAARDPGAAASRGTVVAISSGACRVESEGRLYRCVLPSRLAHDQRSAVAVGDEVTFAAHGDGHRLAEVSPRRTTLSRPDPQNPRRERVIAANVERVVIVVSLARPALRPALVDRYLIAVERGGAEPVILVNKIDLAEGEARERELARLAGYRDAGIPVLACSALTGEGIEDLRRFLAARTAVFVGHSGVGKSSILNALSPGLAAETGALSRRYARGRHTTTRSRLYRLADGVRLIDTPGIRELGLWQLGADELRFYFPELAELGAGCKFNDCSHVHEPECAVRAAVDEGRLASERYATYRRILDSLDGGGAARPS